MQEPKASSRSPWWWHDSLAATGFLSRLPMPAHHPVPVLEAGWCFPLVGLLIGGMAGCVLYLVHAAGLPPMACGLAAIVASTLLTGALHEDGLADLCDGFGGGRDRARKIAIMQDSRIGTYGVLALVLVTMLKAETLAALLAAGPWPGIVGLLAAHAVARAAIIAVAAVLRPARQSGLGHQAGRPGRAGTMAALLYAGALLLVLLPTGTALVVMITTLAVAAGIARLANRQIGGYTGDVFGAVEQLVETVVLATLAASVPA